jgi:hypothetical protein
MVAAVGENPDPGPSLQSAHSTSHLRFREQLPAVDRFSHVISIVLPGKAIVVPVEQFILEDLQEDS